jgi:hypothetical protein
MARRKPKALPRRIVELNKQIESWRQTREKRTRMPEELWDAAVEAARRHGIWKVSNATRVSYESLKARVERAEPPSAPAAVEGGGTAFVSVGAPPQIFGPSEPVATEVELVAVDGARLVVRVEGREGLDVAGLAQAFWKREG